MSGSRIVFGQELGQAVLSGFGDYCIVLAGASLRASGLARSDSTVYATGIAARVVNDGIILSASVEPGVSDAAAVAFQSNAANAVLVNNGSIYGLDRRAVLVDLASAASTVEIRNSGLIDGRVIGILIEDGAVSITNTGTIGGRTGIDSKGGIALDNAGRITGGVALTLSDVASTVLNSGTIGANSAGWALVGGIAADTVVNTGMLQGRVDLGASDDSFDNRLGQVLGPINGRSGQDTLLGGALGEELRGDGDADSIAGGGGNDTIAGGADADELDGGEGFDLLSYFDATGAVLVDLADPTQNQGWAAEDDAFNFEGVIGGTGNDTLLGDAAANRLEGGDGNDVLDGRAGIDTLVGGLGDDLMTVDNARDLIVERAGQGNDTVLASVSYALTANAEVEALATTNAAATTALNLTGSNTANLITGNAGNNRLKGRAGNDTLDGGAGVDNLFGDEGNDSLLGGTENDILRGGLGNDTLDGGDGNDQLFGGEGANVLIGGAGNDFFVFDTPGGTGVIIDFSPVDDVIRLTQAVAPGMPLGTLAAAAFASSVAGVTASTRIYLDVVFGIPSNQRNIMFDADGNGAIAAVAIGTIFNATGVTQADFQFIA